MTTPPEPADPPLGWSVGVGFGVALVSMGVTAQLSIHTEDQRARKTAFEIFAGGLVLAPVASHLIAREWKRAAFFGAVTLATAGLAVSVLEGTNNVLDEGVPATRVMFGGAMALELLVSTGGLVDSLMAGERAQRKRRLAILPLVGRGTAGVSIGGAL